MYLAACNVFLDSAYIALSTTTEPDAIKLIIMQLARDLMTPAERIAFAKHTKLLTKMTAFLTQHREQLSLTAINFFAKITDSDYSTIIPSPELQDTLLDTSRPFLPGILNILRNQLQDAYYYAILIQRAGIILGKLMLENPEQQKFFSENLTFRNLLKETLKKAAWINNALAVNNTLLMIHFMTFNNNTHIKLLLQDKELCTLISDQLYFEDSDVKETSLQLMHTLMGQSTDNPELYFNMFKTTDHDGILKINALFHLAEAVSTLKQKTYATAILLLFFSYHHQKSIPRVIFNAHYIETLKEILSSETLSTIDTGLYSLVSIFKELEITRAKIKSTHKAQPTRGRLLLQDLDQSVYEMQEHLSSDQKIIELIFAQLECNHQAIKSKIVLLIGFLCQNHGKNQTIFGPRFIKKIAPSKIKIAPAIVLKTLLHLLTTYKRSEWAHNTYTINAINKEMVPRNESLTRDIINFIHQSENIDEIASTYTIIGLLSENNPAFIKKILETTDLIAYGLNLARHSDNTKIIANICYIIKGYCEHNEDNKTYIIKNHPTLFSELHRLLKHRNPHIICNALKTIKALITASADNQGSLLTEPNLFMDIANLLRHAPQRIQEHAYTLACSLLSAPHVTTAQDDILQAQVTAFECRPKTSQISTTLLSLFGSSTETPKESIVAL